MEIQVIRSLFFFIDSIVYNIIPLVYQLFLYLSKIDLFSGGTEINQLMQRVYILLGVFMLFKVAFSIIQYMVDPNAFSDSSKGFGKLVTNALVALVLLVSTPIIFEQAFKFQGFVIENNTIGKLILGADTSSTKYATGVENEQEKSMESMARDVQFLIYSAFYSLNSDAVGTQWGCEDSLIIGSKEMARTATFDDSGEPIGGCIVEFQKALEEYPDTKGAGVTVNDFFKYQTTIPDTGQVIIRDDRDFWKFNYLLWWKVDNEYVINYLPLISAIAGGYLVFLLIAFCVDVAIRVIKLCFLQMVAPIAIVSYIDPKESASSSKLMNWVKEVLSTYFSLFLRLVVMFIVIKFISVISSEVFANSIVEKTGMGEGSPYNIFIYVFLIIGAFMFAKQVPKMIESIFGIKGTGDLSLNPFKNAGTGAFTGGLIGSGAGALMGASSAFGAKRGEGKGIFSSIGSGLLGMGSGAARGGLGGIGSGIKGEGFRSVFGGAISASNKGAGNIARNVQLRANTQWKDRLGHRIREASGMETKYETLDRKLKTHESIVDYADKMENQARKKMAQKDNKWDLLQKQREYIEKEFKEKRMNINTYQKFKNKIKTDEDSMITDYINSGGIINGSLTPDGALVSYKTALSRIAKENNFVYENETTGQTINYENLNSWENIEIAKKRATAEINDTEHGRYSDEVENAKAIQDQMESRKKQGQRGYFGSK